MPFFKYKGYDSSGANTGGTIEADSKSDAVRRLRDKEIHIRTISEEKRERWKFFSKGNEISELSQITRQLSTLLSANVPLLDAIKALSEQQEKQWKRVLTDIKESLSAGNALSRALESYSDIFPEYYINMVHAGEMSGKLCDILENLADFLESQYETRTKVAAASLYPLFMLLIGIVVLSFVFTFVVPKITGIFEDSGATLPFITMVLIKVSGLFQNYWWLIIFFFLSGFTGFKIIVKRKEHFFATLINKLSLFRSLYIARFLRTSGFLLDGGLPVTKVLHISARSIGNKFLETSILNAEQQVAEGGSLSSSLFFFPPVIRQIIATGEKGGELSKILLKAANSYENEYSLKVKRYMSIMEPVLILSMGVIIGFVVFAVLLPIFEMNQLIK